jgi:hypothetical protein
MVGITGLQPQDGDVTHPESTHMLPASCRFLH